MQSITAYVAGASRQRPVPTPYLLLPVLFLAVALFDLSDGGPFLKDNDDIVRLIQIRELLKHHKWFDMTLPVISMPETYVSHYSRLVDLPYFLIARALEPFMARDAALHAATMWWPGILLVIFALLSAHLYKRLYTGGISVPETALAIPVAATAIMEFTPGRIDHHNMQMILMFVMLAGLVSVRPVGGLMAGAAMAFSMAIGLEGLPIIFLALSTLALHAVFRPEISARRLAWTGWGMAVLSVPAAVASYGPHYAFEHYCDVFAAPWLAGFGAGGLVLALAPALWTVTGNARDRRATVLRMGTLAIPAVLVSGWFAFAFPDCLAGPYSQVDHLTWTLWLDGMAQERNIFARESGMFGNLAFMASSFLVTLIAAFPEFLGEIRKGRADRLISYVLAAGCFLFFVAYFRSFNFASMFVMLAVPGAVRLFAGTGEEQAGRTARRRNWRIAVMISPIAVVAGLAVTVARNHPEITALKAMHVDQCSGADFSVLNDLPPGRILAPLGVSTLIAEYFPQHTVEAMALHRAAPGIHRMLVAFTSPDPVERKAALAPFDYLAVCARPYEVTGYGQTPLYDKLVHGQPVAGLVPVFDPKDSDFRVFRIKHDALR